MDQTGLHPTPLDKKSIYLRERSIDVLEHARRGHIGATFSLIEILRVLYDDVLKFRSEDPHWKDRDRCLLSKGHGCIALYVVLREHGFFPEEELWKFCKSDGILGGHPEHKVPGVEASTGSLGHGLSIGLGYALAARMDGRKHRTFVVVGDGEINEGSVWEAALCASKHRLDSLTVLVDYNKYQSYASTKEVLDLEPLADKWRAFGFGVAEVDGHDVSELREVLSRLPLESEKPTAIICHTMKGKGVPVAEGNLKWHHKSKISDEDLKTLREGLRDGYA